MNLDQALSTYIAESRGLLDDMESILLRLESEPGDDEMVAALFRAAHTIKGSAGLFGLDDISGFTHVVEEVLDRLRDGMLNVTGDLIGVLLSCCDHMRNLIEGIRGPGARSAAEMQSEGERLVRALRPYLETSSTDPDPATVWNVRVEFGADVLCNGMDPSSFVRYLATLGEITDLSVSLESMPALAKMDPESCYLGMELTIAQVSDRKIIEDAFEFVKDDCSLLIAPACGGHPAGHGVPREEHGARAVPAPELQSRSKSKEETPVDASVENRSRSTGARPPGSGFLRVEAEKLDRLIDRVGELVIAGASASMVAQQLGDAGMLEAAAVINRLVEEIREDALQLRMVQIGETFRRFHRLVHDTARELGKEIELEIHGAETELDKTVIEKIGDPLTHLVRNAMDHGIERAEERARLGKPPRGVLRMSACHDGGSIVIEVSDDGAGIDTDKLLVKAEQRGLIPAGAKLSRQEILCLIFEPGLSTAENVSNLSGRGVGMDVVRRNIEGLRGTIEIESEAGCGTTVRIRLPLTLAIIDGFLVGVGTSRYVVPQELVIECMELSPADREAAEQRKYIDLRGEVLPYLSLRRLFRFEGTAGRRENIVVVQYGPNKAGLVVDELMGSVQTVIKPLGKMFAGVKGISGSTILGNGAVALILDVPSLVQAAREQEASEFDAAHAV